VGSEIAAAHKVPIVAVVPHLWSPAELKSLRTELVLLSLLVVGTVGMSAGASVLRLMKVL
jgi:hypothetical protein